MRPAPGRRLRAALGLAVRFALSLGLLEGCGFTTGGLGAGGLADVTIDADGEDAISLFEVGGEDTSIAASDAPSAETSIFDAKQPLDATDATDATDAGPSKDAADALPPETGVTCTETGAVLWNGHCYFTTTAAAEPAAKADCAARGAHLVTITSQGEQDVVAAVGSGDRWIGLESKKVTDQGADFAWITGEDSAYQHWAAGDPNSGGYCAALRGSDLGWVDRTCTDLYAPICERE